MYTASLCRLGSLDMNYLFFLCSRLCLVYLLGMGLAYLFRRLRLDLV